MAMSTTYYALCECAIKVRVELVIIPCIGKYNYTRENFFSPSGQKASKAALINSGPLGTLTLP